MEWITINGIDGANIQYMVLDEVANFDEERNVMFQDGPSESQNRAERIGKMKKAAHRVIHKENVKKKNRAKNRVAKAARKKGRK